MAILLSPDEADLAAPAAPAGLQAGAGPGRVDLAWGAVEGAVEVEVAAEASASGDRVAEGVSVEVGIAPQGSIADDGTEWTWSPAHAIVSDEAGATFRGALQPESLGSFRVGARASTDGGQTWQMAEGAARIDTIAGDDVQPPTAPGTPELLDVSSEGVRIRWPAPEAADRRAIVAVDCTAAAGECPGAGGAHQVARYGAQSDGSVPVGIHQVIEASWLA